MAYSIYTFSLLSNPPRTNVPNIWGYITAADNAAAVRASGYFDDEGGDYGRLQVNDIIYASSTDGNEWLTVTAVTPAVTTAVATNTIGDGAITTAKLADDAVTNAKLADDAVSLENLDAGIAPSHIVVFAGKESDGGGGATIAITQAGVLTTDIVFAQVEASTNAVAVQKVTPTADTVTVLLSGDPGASTEIAWQVLRAAS